MINPVMLGHLQRQEEQDKARTLLQLAHEMQTFAPYQREMDRANAESTWTGMTPRAPWLGERGYTDYLRQQSRVAQLQNRIGGKGTNFLFRRDPSIPMQSLIRQAQAATKAKRPGDVEDINRRLSDYMNEY